MIVVRRTPKKILANFDAFHWIGKKGADILEWQLNNFDSKSRKYHTNPDFRAETDRYYENIRKVRLDPDRMRKFGVRLAGIYGATALGLGAIGAGAYFLRRRKTKNGKTIVERVRK